MIFEKKVISGEKKALTPLFKRENKALNGFIIRITKKLKMGDRVFL